MTYPTSSDAIEASIKKLATTFASTCSVTALPNKTSSVDPITKAAMPPRTYSYVKIGKGTGPNRPAMLAIAGIHAREWGQPDAVVTFAGNLLAAYAAGGPFTIPVFTDAAGAIHGPVTVSNAFVKVIVEQMDLYLLPLTNPDGRAASMKSAAGQAWRKNCVPLSAPYAPNVGVDLNRNFDIAWDFDVYYSPTAAADPHFTNQTSKDASEEVFIGPAALSEAETKNVKFLLDSFPITYYLDLHSYSQTVMYPWAIETDQTTDASQNFHNSATWDRKRDGVGGTAYQEYFPNAAPLSLFDRHGSLAKAMKDNILLATGASYSVQSALKLYPCTGTSADYAFSRQFVKAGSPDTYSFTLEFGDSHEGFQPTPAQYPKIEREVHAALIAFASYIATWRGLIPAVAKPTGGGGSSGGGGGSTCLFTAVFLDDMASPALRFLRRCRDALKQQPSTTTLMRTVEAVYYKVSPPIARYLVASPRARRLARVGLVMPMVGLLRHLAPPACRDGY